MRRSLILLLLLSAVPMLPAQQKPASATIQLPPKPLLPQSFAGWTATQLQAVATPAEAADPDGETSAHLQELGFRRAAFATYQQGSSTFKLAAYQFTDATGAYSYFPGHEISSPLIEIGNRETRAGVSASLRQGDTVIAGVFYGAPPRHPREDMSALAKMLPIPTGSGAHLPTLPEYLPKTGLDTTSILYAIGPVGVAHAQSPLAGKLDFNTGAEVVIGRYGSGTLTLVEYPTPQMAAAQLKTFATQFNLQPQKSLPNGLLSNAQNVAWRTGPIVALTDSMPQAEAIKLARAIHYEAEITLNKPQGYVSEAWRAAHLYLGIAALAGILCAASVILGLFFGGARAIIRVLRGKSASAVEDTEFISLNLTHGPVHPDGRQD